MDEVQLHHAVSQFLFREARLLDDRRFADWLDLWSDDASYLVPTAWVSSREGLREANDLELHHIRSGKDVLRLRVEKLRSGSAWAEEPPSRMIRSISNVELGHAGDVIEVRSNIVLHRVRYTDDVEVHAASRSDRLRLEDGRWQISRRKVSLAHGVLRSTSFEFFL